MEQKSKASWIDDRRIYVETPQGDDFIVGFFSEDLYRCQRQAPWFEVDKIVASLFDKHYKGDARVIMGPINVAFLRTCKRMIDFYQALSKYDKDDERVRIGQCIKSLRQKEGMDAKTLSAITGIDASNLCRIEAGKYSVGFDILTKIAKVFNKKIDFVDIEEKDHECTTYIRPQSV